MDQLGDLITKRLNQHKLGESASAARVIHHANLFLRRRFPDSEEEVRALRLKDGILTVGVSGAVWNQELWACQAEMLSEIGKECGPKAAIKISIKGLTTN